MINQYESEGDTGWEFFITPGYVNFTNWTFYGYTNCDYNFNPNEWHHVAMTYDRSLGSIQFYVNGSQICNNDFSGDILDTTDDPAYIGYNPSGGDEFSHGLIDELYVFNQALSSDEIMALYQFGLRGNVPWLSVDPVSGNVPTNGSIPVQVTFDATGLQPDIYTTTLYVVSNDPQTPRIDIPVTLTVRYGTYLPLVIKPIEAQLGSSHSNSSPEGVILMGSVMVGIAGRWKRRM
jgi:hypothetical protein